MSTRIAHRTAARLWAALAAAAAWGIAAPPCDAVIRQVFSFKEWFTDFVPSDIMRIFTEMDFQSADIARVEGFQFGFWLDQNIGNADAPASGGPGFSIRESRSTKFWLRDDLRYPRYGVAVTVLDADYYFDTPTDAMLRLYDAGDAVIGEVSVTVPPANSLAEVRAGATFLAAVSSDSIRSWEFSVRGTSKLAFDDVLITYIAIPVPEPSMASLVLAAAALAGLRAAFARGNRTA